MNIKGNIYKERNNHQTISRNNQDGPGINGKSISTLSLLGFSRENCRSLTRFEVVALVRRLNLTASLGPEDTYLVCNRLGCDGVVTSNHDNLKNKDENGKYESK